MHAVSNVPRWPWEVALVADDELVCGGLLVTADSIVTASVGI